MIRLRFHLLVATLFWLTATAALADATVTWSRAAVGPRNDLRFSVGGTFDVAEWNQAANLTVQVGSRIEVIPLGSFRRMGNSAIYAYRSRRSGLVRRALINVNRSTFRLTCISDAASDYRHPLTFSLGLLTRWIFEIPIDEGRRATVFVGLLPGTSGFAVTEFLLVDPALNAIGGDGSDNVPRDARVLLRFSDAVDMTSVSSATIRIGIPVGGNLFIQAAGRFEAVPGHSDQVLFNPTFTVVNTGTFPDNPLGFQPYAAYEVRVPSTAETPTTVRSTSGTGVSSGYAATFATGAGTIQNWGAPSVVRTDPLNGMTAVGSVADIVVEFDVPIDPATFELGSTVFVTNVTAGLPVPLEVYGTLRFSADVKTATFRPLFGYGQGPFDIRMRIATDVTSLSGHHLRDPFELSFTTEFDPTQPNSGVIRESFDNNNQEDTSYPNTDPLAEWNGPGNPGLLIGVLDRSEARSKWYDSGVAAPAYLDALLTPAPGSQPAGTSLTLTFQGAPENPGSPGSPLVAAASAWVGDLTTLSGYRFVRFHVRMVADPATGNQPRLEQIVLPFIFF